MNRKQLERTFRWKISGEIKLFEQRILKMKKKEIFQVSGFSYPPEDDGYFSSAGAWRFPPQAGVVLYIPSLLLGEGVRYETAGSL